jgi:hypothetical protein
MRLIDAAPRLEMGIIDFAESGFLFGNRRLNGGCYRRNSFFYNELW